jgi:uncharacterized protein YndB with AHSA1/START domain
VVGAGGFTSPVAIMDVREEGTSLVCMRSPQGQDLYNTWEYREVVPMRRLEFILNFADENGNRVDPAALGLPPEVPQDVRHVITFESAGDNRTTMTVTEFGYTSDQIFDISKAGLQQCLDKMTAAFAGRPLTGV